MTTTPRSPYTDQPRANIAMMMQIVERDIDSKGWGSTPPMLYRMTSDGSANIGPTLSVDFLNASGFPLRGEFGPTPDAELVTLVNAFEHPLAGFAVALMDGKPDLPMAHVIIREAWWNAEIESIEDIRKLDVDIMDHPATQHVRYAFAVLGNADAIAYIIFYRSKDTADITWLSANQFSVIGIDVKDLLTRFHIAELSHWLSSQRSINN